MLSAGEWEAAGFDVAPLPEEIEAHIARIMPEMWRGWIKNPIDLSIIPFEPATAGLSGDMIRMMARSRSYDLVAVNMSVGGPLSADQLALRFEASVARRPCRPGTQGRHPLVAVVNLGGLGPRDFDDPRWRGLAEAQARLAAAGVPVYPSPCQAAGAISRLIAYHRRRNGETGRQERVG